MTPTIIRNTERAIAAVNALHEAYRLGFAASGEGWNGEHPPSDFTKDAHWIEQRDKDLSALNQPPAMPSREEVAREFALELLRQDPMEEDSPTDALFVEGTLTWRYIDQGEVDFGKIADAVLDLIKKTQERG